MSGCRLRGCVRLAGFDGFHEKTGVNIALAENSRGFRCAPPEFLANDMEALANPVEKGVTAPFPDQFVKETIRDAIAHRITQRILLKFEDIFKLPNPLVGHELSGSAGDIRLDHRACVIELLDVDVFERDVKLQGLK